MRVLPLRAVLFDSIWRKRRIGTEERNRVASEGLVELKERTVSGIWIRQEYGIWQILTEPIGIANGNHFVVNTVDYKSGLTNAFQFREPLPPNLVPLAERCHLRGRYLGTRYRFSVILALEQPTDECLPGQLARRSWREEKLLQDRIPLELWVV